MDSEADAAPESFFRPVKRRKFMRKRPDDRHVSEDTSGAHEAAVVNRAQDHRPDETKYTGAEGDEEQTTGVVRLRRPHVARKGGIGFSTMSGLGKDDHRQTALAPAEDHENEKVQAMCDRFTGHTGQTVDVDKHMMAYIDSEMAKRYNRSPLLDGQEAPRSTTTGTAGPSSVAGAPEREPASLGKLHEIDLGQETKLQNIARTEAATKRMVGDENEMASEEPDTLIEPSGPDDKRWRHRKRRTSADIERDRLVEEVLRESKLDVYDEGQDDDAPLDDQAADDRIAEQFRRDFLDAIQSRRRVARNRNPKAEKDEAPKGPKLGGSRSARAAMRDMQSKPGQK